MAEFGYDVLVKGIAAAGRKHNEALKEASMACHGQTH